MEMAVDRGIISPGAQKDSWSFSFSHSVVHLVVEDFSEELLQCLLCHKEPATHIQSPFCLLLACSLWHKGAYNRTFLRMEANYPYAIMNQRGASNATSCVFMA